MQFGSYEPVVEVCQSGGGQEPDERIRNGFLLVTATLRSPEMKQVNVKQLLILR